MAPFPSVFRVEATRLSVTDEPLEYERANRAAIEAHWQWAKARRPRIWNGEFFMFSGVGIEEGTLRATGHRTDFATFLHWCANGRPYGVSHISGTSLPETADGALLAVRMADHTVNAGEVYFPAGSLDAEDLVSGRLDVMNSIAREMAEETGLGLGEGDLDRDFTVAFDRNALHVARRGRLNYTFAECAARLAEHQAETGDDEVTDAVAIRPGSIDRLKPYARLLADWHFANPPAGA